MPQPLHDGRVSPGASLERAAAAVKRSAKLADAQVPNGYYGYTRYGFQWMLAQTRFSIERIEPCSAAIATVGQ